MHSLSAAQRSSTAFATIPLEVDEALVGPAAVVAAVDVDADVTPGPVVAFVLAVELVVPAPPVPA